MVLAKTGWGGGTLLCGKKEEVIWSIIDYAQIRPTAFIKTLGKKSRMAAACFRSLKLTLGVVRRNPGLYS